MLQQGNDDDDISRINGNGSSGSIVLGKNKTGGILLAAADSAAAASSLPQSPSQSFSRFRSISDHFTTPTSSIGVTTRHSHHHEFHKVWKFRTFFSTLVVVVVLQVIRSEIYSSRSRNMSWMEGIFVIEPNRYSWVEKTATAKMQQNILHEVQSIRNSSTNRNTNSTKPFLYLHIGPHKTGTTTIQNLLALYHEELLQDDVVYLGKINDEMKRKYSLSNDIVRPLRAFIDGKSGSQQAMLRLKRKLVQCSKRSQNVVMSNEYLSDIYKLRIDFGRRVLERFHKMMDPFFQVRVVLSYRRYPDWLYSLYNYAVVMDSGNDKWPTNKEQQGDINDRGKNIRDYRGNNFKMGRIRTPSVREFMAFPSARSRIEKLIKVYAPQQDVSSSTISTGNRWNVHVVDMQNMTYGDVGLDYLCHIIEPAKRACQHYKEDIAKEEHMITRVSNSATGRISASDYLLAMYVRYGTQIGQNLTSGLRKSETAKLLKRTFEQWTSRNINNKTLLELPWEIRSEWKYPNQTIDFLNNDGHDNVTVPFSHTEIDLSKLLSSGVLEQWLQRNGGDDVIPLECPLPQEYELIWKTLLKEEELVHKIQWGTGSGLHRQDGDGALRSYFDGFVSSNKVCHFDLDVLYHRNKSWREFMEAELTKIKGKIN